MHDFSHLNISIVNSSQLNYGLRIDPYHYSKKFSDILTTVKQDKKYQSIKQLISEPVKTGHTPSMAEPSFWSGEIPFIKTNHLRENRIVDSFEDFLTEKGSKTISGSKLKENDVIVTIIGATEDIVGRAARIHSELEGSHINQNIALIRAKIPSGYLVAFLNSHYGRQQLYYLSRQTEQVNLNCREVEEVLVPIPSDELLSSIHSLITKTYLKEAESKEILEGLKLTLLSHLGFDNFNPSTVNYSSRSSKEANEANRLDGEYWLPVYDEILNIINSYQNGVSQIGKTFKQIKSNFKPEKDSKYKYVEIGDINIAQPDFSYTELMGDELPANAKIKLNHKTLVTSKVRPNRGATAILNDENEYIVSGAFVALQEKEMNLETLYAYLKLEPIKELLLRYNTGTSYPTITDNDVLNLPIPNITADVQSEIQSKVVNATELLSHSKRLLEVAKRAVEVFIEQDENAALEYIRQNYEQV